MNWGGGHFGGDHTTQASHGRLPANALRLVKGCAEGIQEDPAYPSDKRTCQHNRKLHWSWWARIEIGQF